MIALISIFTPRSQGGHLEMDPGRCWAPSIFVSQRKKIQSLRGVTENLLNLCPEEDLTIFFFLSLLYWAANKSALCLGRWCYFYIPRLFHSWKKCLENTFLKLLLLFSHLCPTLCSPMDCSMPGSSVLHYLREFAQTQMHWISVAIPVVMYGCETCIIKKAENWRIIEMIVWNKSYQWLCS